MRGRMPNKVPDIEPESGSLFFFLFSVAAVIVLLIVLGAHYCKG